MSIQKIERAAGIRWRARVYVDGYQESRVFPTRREAEQWEREQLYLRDHPEDNPALQPHPSTVAELYTQWSEHHVNALSPGSQLRYRQVFDLYILPEFTDRAVQDITTAQVRAWFARLQHTDLSISTCNQVLARFKAMLLWGMRQGLTYHNPASALSSVRQHRNEDEADMHVWTSEEASAFLAYAQNADPALWRLCLTAINTGMRLGELVALRTDKVDLKRRLIHVARIWDNKARDLQEHTKGRRSRYVGINPVVQSALAEVMLRRLGPWVLCEENGERIPSNTLTEARFRPACVVAGVPEIRFHDLRHTYAVHFMLAGGDIYQLQRILGHQSISTTEKYLRYAQRFRDELVDAASLVTFGGRKSTSNAQSS